MNTGDDRDPTSAWIVAVCAGGGGIPKHELDSGDVQPLGIVGDAHGFSKHGGKNRAVCLLSTEAYASLRMDDVACTAPGTFGENVLTEGLDDATLRPGDRLRLGEEVVLEIHDVRAPCAKLKSIDRRFPDLMLGRSGWVCRVIQTGTIRPGMTIERL